MVAMESQLYITATLSHQRFYLEMSYKLSEIMHLKHHRKYPIKKLELRHWEYLL